MNIIHYLIMSSFHLMHLMIFTFPCEYIFFMDSTNKRQEAGIPGQRRCTELSSSFCLCRSCVCALLFSAYLLNPLLWLLSKDSQRSCKVISKRALRRIIQLSLLKDLRTSPPLSFLHSVPHLWHVAFSAQDDDCVHTHQHLQNNQNRHTCQHLKTHVWVIPHGTISFFFFFF